MFATNTKKRQKNLGIKASLVAYKGGRCERCGGVFHPAVFDFHHRHSLSKQFGMNAAQFYRPIAELELEADKCYLLCANCHREVHAFPDLRFMDEQETNLID